MMKKIIGLLIRLGIASILVLAGLIFYTNVETSLTPEDTAVFENILGINKPTRSLSYSEEIKLIRKVQAKAFIVAPVGEGIAEEQRREPADLLRAGQGLCYDRSRFLDKALNYAGFETRHVYLLYRNGEKYFITSLFQRGHPSHAATEVKTSRGWLFVDSNSPWIAVSRNGIPIDADNVWKKKVEFDSAPEYLLEPSWAIRGMYSRHGGFYPPYIPFPEFNWRDFLHWLFS